MTTPAQPKKRRGRPPSGGREAILTATLELLRERGVARLTTREIAQRAGTSEASLFYHYTDRAGLMQAVFKRGVDPLRGLTERGIEGNDHLDAFTQLGDAIERFLDEALPILVAAQSDIELRDALAAYMAEHYLGPHRGVHALASYLTVEQRAGRIRPDVDPPAIAMMLVASCFLRVFQSQLAGNEDRLPTAYDTAAALDTLLRPASAPNGAQQKPAPN